MKSKRIDPSLFDDPGRMESFLLANSGLPGPRANLELASLFASHSPPLFVNSLWRERILAWASITAAQAPTQHPREYLPFVALQALGAAYLSCDAQDRVLIEGILRLGANDARWRTREACAMGLQAIGMESSDALLAILQRWLQQPSLLDLRAVLAALADPPLLCQETVLAFALEAADTALAEWSVAAETSQPTDESTALHKALAFAPSVFVAADPVRGFRMLERWADVGSVAIAKLVVANLRKARLAKQFPDEVSEVAMRLEASCPQ